MIQPFLSSVGIELRTACSIDEVLRQPLQSAPVVFYDTDLPVPWRVALKQLLLRWPACRVVFVSRLADNSMWVDMLDAGAFDLLMKPFRTVEIQWILRGALLGTRTVSAAGR